MFGGVQGGLSSTSVLLIIALAGTTVAPWQLFFQQSNVVDKRITPRWLSYERADTLIGTVLVIVGAAAVMLACAWAFAGSPLHGGYRDAGSCGGGAGGQRIAAGGHPVRHSATGRLYPGRRGGIALELLRRRGLLRVPPFASSPLASGALLSRQLRGVYLWSRPSSRCCPPPRWGSLRPGHRRSRGSFCRAQPCSCCCCATTARYLGHG